MAAVGRMLESVGDEMRSALYMALGWLALHVSKSELPSKRPLRTCQATVCDGQALRKARP